MSAYVIDAPTLSRPEIDMLMAKARQRSASGSAATLNRRVSGAISGALFSVAGGVWLMDMLLLLPRMR
jgi:hypothetical protein